MVAALTPTIAKIKNETSLTEVRALLSIAICEVCDFFNVGKNMNDKQIAFTADLIIEQYWYLKLEEIKYCFHRAMRQERLYDRLDGNIILSWLADYDAQRAEAAINISHNEEIMAKNKVTENPDGKDFESYIKELRQRAVSDDKAKELLENYELIKAVPPLNKQSEEQRNGFRKFKMSYLLNKHRNDAQTDKK